MKTIITSLLLLILSFNLSAQDTITKEPIRLSDYRYFPELKDSILNVLKKMEYEQFMSIPQAEINLGIHKFKKQHIIGNNLIIAGLITTTIGSLIMMDQGISSKGNPGIFITSIGSGLTTSGFIVNIDSFRHLK
jgi:hypothetical protein